MSHKRGWPYIDKCMDASSKPYSIRKVNKHTRHTVVIIIQGNEITPIYPP